MLFNWGQCDVSALENMLNMLNCVWGQLIKHKSSIWNTWVLKAWSLGDRQGWGIQGPWDTEGRRDDVEHFK